MQRDWPALEAPALHTLRLIAQQSWRHCVTSLRSAHWLASSLKLAAHCPVIGCWPSCCSSLMDYVHFSPPEFNSAWELSKYTATVHACGVPVPANRHHRSNGDCLEGKRENYQVSSVQYCVQQLCTVRCTHIWTDLMPKTHAPFMYVAICWQLLWN